MIAPAIPDNGAVDSNHDDPNATVFIDRASDRGAWDRELPFCVNIKILNDTSGQLPDGDSAPVSGLIPFHTPENTDV